MYWLQRQELTMIFKNIFGYYIDLGTGEATNAGKTEREIVNLNPLEAKYKYWHWGFITIQKMTEQIYRGLMTKTM